MTLRRLRLSALLLASGLGLGACAYHDGYGGYGYGGVSAGYGDGWCDPYWGDCYDPWYGWYDG